MDFIAMSQCRELVPVKADKLVSVKAFVNPLDRDDFIYHEASEGSSILDIIGEDAAYSAEVSIGGVIIPRDSWNRIRPKSGTELRIDLYPQGKSTTKVVEWIVVLVAAYFQQWWLVRTMLVSMAAQALIKPPKPKSLANTGPAQSLLGITGTSNQSLPFGPIPIPLGSISFFPPHAAQPYTEILGDEEYLRCLMDLGHGNLSVGNIYVGNTPIASLTDVEYQIATSPSLFSNSINEQSINLEMDTDNGPFIIKTTTSIADEASLDLNFLGGFFGLDNDGNLKGGTMDFVIEQSVSGANSFSPIATASGLQFSSNQGSVNGSYIRVRSSSKNPFRLGVRWKLPSNTVQYDVRVQRLTTTWDSGTASSSQISGMQWGAFRTIRYVAASSTNTTKLAMRFKATTQTQSVVQQIRVELQQLVPTWDEVNNVWKPANATSNPAWIAYWFMTSCPGVARTLPTSRLVFNDWNNFANYCDSKGFTCNMVIDSVDVMQNQLDMILACGRGSLVVRDLGYGIVYDDTQTQPVDYFTPATMKNFTVQASFPKLPHALRVNFMNPEANWQQDQIIVLADGYAYDYGSGPVDCNGNAAPSLPTATLFDTIDLKGTTSPRIAWQHGRYHLVCAYKRLKLYTGEIDIQSLRVTRGDLVSVQHDLPSWGVGAGRIKYISPDGKTVTVDGGMEYPTGTLECQVRTDTGTTFTQHIIPVNSTVDANGNNFTDTFSFTDTNGVVTSPQFAVALDDLFIVGTPNLVTKNLIVTMTKGGKNLSGTLSMVEADPEVWTADSGTMPTFTSGITHAPWEEPPPDPTNLVIISSQLIASTDDGGVSRGGRANVLINRPSGMLRLPSYKMAQIFGDAFTK